MADFWHEKHNNLFGALAVGMTAFGGGLWILPFLLQKPLYRREAGRRSDPGADGRPLPGRFFRWFGRAGTPSR